jgi:hypothetical protein
MLQQRVINTVCYSSLRIVDFFIKQHKKRCGSTKNAESESFWTEHAACWHSRSDWCTCSIVCEAEINESVFTNSELGFLEMRCFRKRSCEDCWYCRCVSRHNEVPNTIASRIGVCHWLRPLWMCRILCPLEWRRSIWFCLWNTQDLARVFYFYSWVRVISRSRWLRGLNLWLRPLACWDCGFESRRGHGCLSLVGVLCCQRFLRRADHSSREVLPSVCVCVCVCVIECDQVQQ